MNKIKSFLAILTIVIILVICSLSALATITTSTYAVWNATETKAYAKTDCYSPSATNFYIDAWIRSNTGEYKYKSKYCTTGGSNSVSTDWASVSYGLPLPLVEVGGDYWFD